MKTIDLKRDNGIDWCGECKYYSPADYEVGVNYESCDHDIYYHEGGDFKEELADDMSEALYNPKHCIFFEKK